MKPESPRPPRSPPAWKNPARRWRSWPISTTLPRPPCVARPSAGCPPTACAGRLGGIYLRPQFLDASPFLPNQALKKIGFRRLIRNGWLNPLLLFDPLLCDVAPEKISRARRFICSPIRIPKIFTPTARRLGNRFNLPDDKFVLLFYGGGYKRKGLHLAVRSHARNVRARPGVFAVRRLAARQTNSWPAILKPSARKAARKS